MTSSTAGSPTSDAKTPDPLVLQNRIAVSLAQRRKLVSSWLPPSVTDESQNGCSKSAEEIAVEEAEIWKSRPVTLGVGHPIPLSSSTTEAYNRSSDLLRRRLLDKDSIKSTRQRHLERTQAQRNVKRASDSASSDEEGFGGRGAIVNRVGKKRKFKAEDKSAAEAGDEDRGSREGEISTIKQGADEIQLEDTDADSTGGFVSLPTKPEPLQGKKQKRAGSSTGGSQSRKALKENREYAPGDDCNATDPSTGAESSLMTDSSLLLPSPEEKPPKETGEATKKKKKKKKQDKIIGSQYQIHTNQPK